MADARPRPSANQKGIYSELCGRHTGCLSISPTSMRPLAFSALVAALAADNAFSQKRNITEKDLWDFVWLGDPQISRDGSRVAFVRVTVNEKKEGYNTS